jgi:hypothetical protein
MQEKYYVTYERVWGVLAENDFEIGPQGLTHEPCETAQREQQPK